MSTTPLKQLLDILNKRLELDELDQMETEKSAQGITLYSNGFERKLSPTLPKKQMELWLDGFLEGLDYRRHQK